MHSCEKPVANNAWRLFPFTKKARDRKPIFTGFVTWLIVLSLLLAFVASTRASLNFSSAEPNSVPTDSQSPSLFDQPANADANVIVVPDEYATISQAVANASAGGTVFVRNGIYRENPVITKPLTVVGENAAGTIVIGSGGVPNAGVFTVSADDVVISGFTTQSQNYSKPSDYASGINIAGDNCSIVGNVITNVYKGIYVGGWDDLCGGKTYTTISENNFTGCFSDAIRLLGGYGNTISRNSIVMSNASAIAITGYSNTIVGNNLEGNRRGIGLGSSHTVVHANNITGCIDWGIYFQTSSNVISANNIENNRYGVYLSPAFAPVDNWFFHNNFVNNTHQSHTGSVYNIQVWDDGYPSGGNFWSTFSGADLKSGPNQDAVGSDQIGDTPMVLDANNSDGFPLLVAFNVSNAGSPPTPAPPPTVEADRTAALWQFDTVEVNGVTPDAVGNNPAVLGTAVGEIDCPPQPVFVDGKFGKALLFDVPQYVYATASPSLDMSGEIAIDAWIKLAAYENTVYNNIMVQGARTLNKYQERVYGFAVNGQDPENATSGPPGALCGYVYTDAGYNEIVTLDPAVPLNAWIHVTFTRSLTSGMHIYVDGEEKPVKVTAGVQNPAGDIKRGTELNIGHDYIGVIDELHISNSASVPPVETPASDSALRLQGWVWALPAAVCLTVLIAVLLLKRRKNEL